MTENVNANIPPAKGFDEFQTLSSTKQNIELFKILSAIAEEIEGLRQSTERRFHLIESLVQQNGKKKYILYLAHSSEISGNFREINFTKKIVYSFRQTQFIWYDSFSDDQ